MTKVRAFIHGIYPRSKALVETSRDVERKRKKIADLYYEQKKDFKNLVSLQRKEKFEYVEDGKLNWQDIFRPIVEATHGFEVGALTRWFDNNSFYRQPIIKGKLSLNREKLDSFFPQIKQSKQKVTIPSPYLFAKVADDKTTQSFERTLDKVAEILSEIVFFLEEKGVFAVALNEPYVPYHKVGERGLMQFKKALKRISKSHKKIKLLLQLYFGDGSLMAKELSNDHIVDALGIDFYRTTLTSLPKKIPFAIAAGVLEARNSLLEDEKRIRVFVDRVSNRYPQNTIYLTHNSDLDLLPEEVARKKIKLLGSLQKFYEK